MVKLSSQFKSNGREDDFAYIETQRCKIAELRNSLAYSALWCAPFKLPIASQVNSMNWNIVVSPIFSHPCLLHEVFLCPK